MEARELIAWGREFHHVGDVIVGRVAALTDLAEEQGTRIERALVELEALCSILDLRGLHHPAVVRQIYGICATLNGSAKAVSEP